LSTRGPSRRFFFLAFLKGKPNLTSPAHPAHSVVKIVRNAQAAAADHTAYQCHHYAECFLENFGYIRSCFPTFHVQQDIAPCVR
jgi:hypothetical protein